MDLLILLWLSLYKTYMVTCVQIVDEAVCISYSGKTLGKGMKPNVEKIVKQTGLFNLCMATGLGGKL